MSAIKGGSPGISTTACLAVERGYAVAVNYIHIKQDGRASKVAKEFYGYYPMRLPTPQVLL